VIKANQENMLAFFGFFFLEKGGTRPSLSMIDACGLLLASILELSFAKNYIMGHTGSIHVSTI
jgi:hypothetical protein